MSLLGKLYGPFFNGHNWAAVITSGQDWLIIFSLVLIECLLSVDNAIVLAAQTRVLPSLKEQEESLFYGIWGSYIFRFLVIGLGTYLIHFWEIKVLGSVYLIYLVYRFFSSKFFGKPKKKKRILKINSKLTGRKLFWSVVVQIEMMDIIFSIDSVLASLAVSNNPVIVLIGGMIGIACMRGVAEVIMKLMRKIPELEPMAYVLIFIIAIKLFLTIPAIDIELPSSVFGIFVLIVFVATLVIHYLRQPRKRGEE
ncbi:TerC family protein [Limosilactobacillus fastidiosus]|uniref:TerC family protein n=1 Tax=Limosilactobacillus fastidiosus TaxID=2759855 RepID=A0A7W3TYW6_9LACO|nr:TerC family protein [Limosilactobacillus fastidiosus]MBB1063470.1 TerC family protein [Limosilactobacillus fastidiosus]MBB1085838.1 TerC family protein [Limosilactobacillus fastidiosus]MCD7084738.1 TerC family protein [Limosilactobacillus fastidiosus]MCD7085825.1 TerC family protein [Limosilactobacillus fastidiosus]MCD7113902.1 TerC family protein [Limosilactobacillus fastidiosus]